MSLSLICAHVQVIVMEILSLPPSPPVVPEVPDDISIAPVPSSSLTQHVYIVLCRILGEQHLVFTAGNDPTSKNKFPADETIAIKYVHVHVHVI